MKILDTSNVSVEAAQAWARLSAKTPELACVAVSTQPAAVVLAVGRAALNAGVITICPRLRRVVQAAVIRLRQDAQILYTVVRLIAIDVVDIFPIFQRPAQMLRHDPTMFIDGTAINEPYQVAARVAMDPAAPPKMGGSGLRGVLARSRTVFTSTFAGVTWVGQESLLAPLACDFDLDTGTFSGHRSLQSAGAMPRDVGAPPGLHHASILPSTSQKAVIR